MLAIKYLKIQRMDGIQVMFELIIELCRLITGNNLAMNDNKYSKYNKPAEEKSG